MNVTIRFFFVAISRFHWKYPCAKSSVFRVLARQIFAIMIYVELCSHYFTSNTLVAFLQRKDSFFRKTSIYSIAHIVHESNEFRKNFYLYKKNSLNANAFMNSNIFSENIEIIDMKIIFMSILTIEKKNMFSMIFQTDSVRDSPIKIAKFPTTSSNRYFSIY